MSSRTLLYDAHLKAGAKIVDFGGWEMPLHYGSQIEEHHQVRRGAGMFDVSHMTVVDFQGAGSRDYLRALLANDVVKLKTPGKALYSCMLNPQGGVIDDLIVYYLADDWFRMVVNAATREKDLAWMRTTLGDYKVEMRERAELAMIAVQGPQACERAISALGSDNRAAASELKKFSAVSLGELFVARTGYTGEDGFEIMVPADQAQALWEKFVAAGIQPCGLGARDTLRLEAGMNLYGQDMDDQTTPLESGLGWTVAWMPESRQFVGRAALERQKKAGVERVLVGIVLEERGVLRSGQKVMTESGEGLTTSGTFSPTLGQAIAMARVPEGSAGECRVEVRNRLLKGSITKSIFVRDGKPCV